MVTHRDRENVDRVFPFPAAARSRVRLRKWAFVSGKGRLSVESVRRNDSDPAALETMASDATALRSILLSARDVAGKGKVRGVHK